MVQCPRIKFRSHSGENISGFVNECAQMVYAIHTAMHTIFKAVTGNREMEYPSVPADKLVKLALSCDLGASPEQVSQLFTSISDEEGNVHSSALFEAWKTTKA
jgi:hypothetical protein